MSDTLGIYIHIPFCKSKCPYCDFFSKSGSESEYDRYKCELINKIEYWSKKTDRKVSSVYFGGGTPSVLGAHRLSEILLKIKEVFAVEENAEITAEINPESGKEIDFKIMRYAGFNRISVGLQSAVKRELSALGRIHTAEEARLTIKKAITAGIENTSLDLMLGIPYQTIESLRYSLDFCKDCKVKHVSMYLLKLEEGTKFYDMRENLNLADEDMQADLYLFAVEYLKNLGYEQYEISNFAFKGFESRHNSSYWKCAEYIGIGPSAHSFFNGKRFFYGRSIEDFYNNIIINDGEGGSEEEYIMLSLRLNSGLNFTEFEKKFKKNLSSDIMLKIKEYANAGFMNLDNNRACFTPKGFLVSNSIISKLI